MTRARFKTEVKLFAINERADGKRWQIIRQHIQERFNVPPPTVRAMEKWEKSLNRETITAELMKDVKGQLPKVEAAAQMQVAQNLLPVLFKAKEAGQDMETAAWKWFFQWVETWLGRERFKHLIEEYFAEQKGSLASTTKETKI